MLGDPTETLLVYTSTLRYTMVFNQCILVPEIQYHYQECDMETESRAVGQALAVTEGTALITQVDLQAVVISW